MVDDRNLDLSIVLLTEDGAHRAHEVWVALAQQMLRLVDPKCQIQRVALVKPPEVVRKVMHGNQWQAEKPKALGLRRDIVTFGRFIADKLLEESTPPQHSARSFVFFHFDGDHAWGDRHLAKTEKIAALTRFLARHVVPAIDHALNEQRRAGRDVDVETGRKAALLRLRRLTPFHSIEAWLFQNSAVAARLCARSCGRHLEDIRAWQEDRGALDELAGDEQPKNQLRPCVESPDHVELATNGYPGADVLRAGKSYAAAIDNLRRCRDLRRALARTHSR